MDTERDARQRILDAAAELFGERGKTAVSTAEIARKATINKAMIFYYFGSKEKLYQAALRAWFSDLTGTVLEKLAGTEPGLSMIEAFVRAHIGYLLKRPAMVKLVIRELLSHDSSPNPLLSEGMGGFLTIRDKLFESFLIAKARGEIRDVDPIHTAVNIISMDIFFFLGKPIVKMINSDVDLNEFGRNRVNHIIDLLMNGLRKRPELQPPKSPEGGFKRLQNNE
ncbi:MAG: TetR/AcrR family transcriptional regulator [Candidatus Latescibacter sp.]|nr:TetR/AcrR family transcriptional regulator [Candidatus Latescibacter sp.]